MQEFSVVSRDVFARLDHIHRQVQAGLRGCACCGGARHNRKLGRYLFEYGVWHDGGRVDWEGKLFCSKSCHDTYF